MFLDVMKDSIYQWIGVDPAYFMIGAVVLFIILFAMIIIQQNEIKALRVRLDKFMSGDKTESFEDEINIRFRELDSLKEVSLSHTKQIEEIGEFLKVTYSKIGIVKYDAFKEMGGNMSFVLCLLNDKNDGMMLNAMHNREGCYTYIKEIIGGESYIQLSEEEKEALNIAVNERNYM